MLQNSKEEFENILYSRIKLPFSRLLYYLPLIVFLTMPVTGLLISYIYLNKTLLGWFLTLSSIVIFLLLLTHSECLIIKNRTIFLVAVINGYLLEFVLVNILSKYSYQNLPLMVINVPILIPLGWVSAFYATSFTAKLLLDKIKIFGNIISMYFVIFTLGVIYGFFLEKLAASKELWDFHFTSVSLFSVPLLATLAWGLTLSNFDYGMSLIQNNRYSNFLVLIVIFVLNLIIAWILLYFL